MAINKKKKTEGSRSQINFKVDLHDRTPLPHGNKTALWTFHWNRSDQVTFSEIKSSITSLQDRSTEQKQTFNKSPIFSKAITPYLFKKSWLAYLIFLTVWIIKYGEQQLILKDTAVFFYSTIDCGFLPSGHGLFRVNVRIPLSE